MLELNKPPGGLNRGFMVHSASMTLTNDCLYCKKMVPNNISYIDLAMAKSEALDNIYSLLKQNKNKIKLCDAKW